MAGVAAAAAPNPARCLLPAQNKGGEFAAPLTSFDWNELDPRRVGTASIDTTCTIWDVERGMVDTQLIAHDKEVRRSAGRAPSGAQRRGRRSALLAATGECTGGSRHDRPPTPGTHQPVARPCHPPGV